MLASVNLKEIAGKANAIVSSVKNAVNYSDNKISETHKAIGIDRQKTVENQLLSVF